MDKYACMDRREVEKKTDCFPYFLNMHFKWNEIAYIWTDNKFVSFILAIMLLKTIIYTSLNIHE